MTYKNLFSCVVSAFTLFLITTSALASDNATKSIAPRTVSDITKILASYKPDPMRVEEMRKLEAVLDGLPPQTADRKELAKYYLKRANAAGELGAQNQEADNLAKAVEYGGGEDILREAQRLGIIATITGTANISQALTLNKFVLDNAPPNDGMRVSMNGLQASLYTRLGEWEEARKSIARAEDVFTRAQVPAIWAASRMTGFESTRALYFLSQGKLAEAEASVRKAMDANLIDLKDNQIRLERRIATFPQNEVEYRAALLKSRLAAILTAQGRLAEAEAVAREVVQQMVALTDVGSLKTANGLYTLALVLQQQGRYSEVGQIVSACMQNLGRAGLPADSLIVGDLQVLLAGSFTAQGRYTEAIAEYQKRQSALATNSDIQSKFAAGDINWAFALLKTGNYEGALVMLDRLIPRNQQWLGATHLDTMELLGVKAMALSSQGDKSSALKTFRLALPVLLAAATSRSDEPSPLRAVRHKLILEAYLDLLGEVFGTPLEAIAGIDAASEAFRIADALRNQSTQSAVGASALRVAANDPKIGREIRKEQDLTQEMIALHKILRDLMSAPAENQLPKVIVDMKQRIENIKKERVALQSEIEKNFPAYANLINPQPPNLAEARGTLQKGEALINVFSTDSATYLWAFKKSGPVYFSTAKITREQIARRVQVLRKALDPGNVDLSSGIPDFDLDVAYSLYRDLLAPVSTGWQGASHLLVASNGALGQLPLATLPTAKVTTQRDPKLPYAHFKDIPWLIRQAAITYLPSVNALLSMRKLAQANVPRLPFVGFGDPEFTVEPILLASGTRRLRNLTIDRPSQADVAEAKLVEWMDYAKLTPLPDTRDEIFALAQALKADPKTDVFVGREASRANVKKLDLSKRRVLAFATHGLLAGEFPGVSQPSLALANPGGGQHGLLTLEDIVGLKLDADIVVLSACNTGGGDGQNTEALSGLGRGFFYAGSRALLVTHWPVETVSASLLVTGIFERQAADTKLSRAEALQLSMLALMQQRDKVANFFYAHPLFWAPYTLIGEGGVRSD